VVRLCTATGNKKILNSSHRGCLCFLRISKPIPVTVLSKVWIWSRLIARIAGSNPTEGVDVRLLCLCDGPITRSRKSYRVCVCACVRVSICLQSRNFNNEAAWARDGILHHIKMHHRTNSEHHLTRRCFPNSFARGPLLVSKNNHVSLHPCWHIQGYSKWLSVV